MTGAFPRAFALVLLTSGALLAADGFEPAPSPKASELLPASLLKGPTEVWISGDATARAKQELLAKGFSVAERRPVR